MGTEGLVSKSQKKRCRKVEKVEGNRRSVQFGKNKAEEKPCTVKKMWNEWDLSIHAGTDSRRRGKKGKLGGWEERQRW